VSDLVFFGIRCGQKEHCVDVFDRLGLARLERVEILTTAQKRPSEAKPSQHTIRALRCGMGYGVLV
jgi:hypothetical protein